MIGTSPDTAITYEHETDIYSYLERTFGIPSKTNFHGIQPDSYFILTEQTLREPSTHRDYRIVYVEDSKGQNHKIFFKKMLT